MKHSAAKILTTSLLVAVFAVSNIGLPIVMYLCPMMEQTMSSQCCMAPKQSGAEQLAFVNQLGSCCQQYVVAERNTTPFLSVDKYQAPNTELLAIIGLGTASIQTIPLASSSTLTFSSPESPGDTPLFVLHSALLI